MRPQNHWMLASKRGPNILLAAVVVVAGVIGISGIYPQVIDAQRVQDAPTHLMSLSAPTTKRSGAVAAISLPPRRVVTTGGATVSSPRPASELSQLRTAVAAVEPPAETATPLGVAEIPDVQADMAKPAEKSRAAVVVKKAVVVRKKVVRVEHHQHSHSGAYAQNGGWGWPGGGWAGFSPFSEIASARRYSGSASLSRFVARSNNARFATVGWSGP